MKIIYLLPPSEGKKSWWEIWTETLSFPFQKPREIANNATQKDLKCSGKRFEEGRELNKNIKNSLILPAIERYSWVMYTAIDYDWMTQQGKDYFKDNFLILSWMYGVLKSDDVIWNYKLPVETKWLYIFWWEKITQALNSENVDIIVDLLPNSYKKLIHENKIKSKIIRIDFYSEKNGELKKISHGVKKIKGEYIKNLCETGWIKIPEFGENTSVWLDIII